MDSHKLDNAATFALNALPGEEAFASMSEGVALQARMRWPGIDRELAKIILAGSYRGAALSARNRSYSCR